MHFQQEFIILSISVLLFQCTFAANNVSHVKFRISERDDDLHVGVDIVNATGDGNAIVTVEIEGDPRGIHFVQIMYRNC